MQIYFLIAFAFSVLTNTRLPLIYYSLYIIIISDTPNEIKSTYLFKEEFGKTRIKLCLVWSEMIIDCPSRK